MTTQFWDLAGIKYFAQSFELMTKMHTLLHGSILIMIDSLSAVTAVLLLRAEGQNS